MTSINIPRDDLGTLDIKLNNSSSEAIKPTNEARPTPATQESNNRVLPQDSLPHQEKRRKGDRRKEDRRQKQVPVLLDTRVQGDRRQQARRRSDAESNQANNQMTEETSPPHQGFDDYA